MSSKKLKCPHCNNYLNNVYIKDIIHQIYEVRLIEPNKIKLIDGERYYDDEILGFFCTICGKAQNFRDIEINWE